MTLPHAPLIPWPHRDAELIAWQKAGNSDRAIARLMGLKLGQITHRVARLIAAGALTKRASPINGAPVLPPHPLPPNAYRLSFGLSPLVAGHPISAGAIAL